MYMTIISQFKKLRKAPGMIMIKIIKAFYERKCMNEFLPTPGLYHFQGPYRRHKFTQKITPLKQLQKMK